VVVSSDRTAHKRRLTAKGRSTGTVRIEQEARYAGDRWHWGVWIEGPDSELDEIEAVEYTLHETFPEPVQLVSNRAAKFRLENWGWGEFEINAHAFAKDGSAHHLKHWLELSGPEGEHAPTKETESSKGPRLVRRRRILGEKRSGTLLPTEA
jgi:transcription initiation factor IIF auxiliary subunit